MIESYRRLCSIVLAAELTVEAFLTTMVSLIRLVEKMSTG